MEPASSKRPSVPRQHNRKSPPGSPLPTRHAPSKKRKRKRERRADRKSQDSAEYYSVKDILDEKTVRDEILYLIDWEDNLETGEPYTPTWEPYDNVSREAIIDWQRKKEGKRPKYSPAPQHRHTTEPPKTDHQPPNPIHQASPKKPWRAGTTETARFQSVSQESLGAQNRPKEIKDSYDEGQDSSNGSGNVCVAVSEPDSNFDRDAYTVLAGIDPRSSQTQPSQITPAIPSPPIPQPTQSSIESVFRPQYINPTPRRKPFTWDGPAPVIPDSQELPGSSSYIFSEPDPFSSQVTQDEPSGVSGESSGIRARNSEASSYRLTQRSVLNDSIESSGRPLPRAETPTSGQQDIATTGISDQSTQQERADKRVQSVPDTESANLSTTPQTLSSAPSEFPITSTRFASSAIQVRATEPPEDAQPHQNLQAEGSQSDVSDLQFLTQVPFSVRYEDSSQIVDDSVNQSPDRSRRLHNPNDSQPPPTEESDEQFAQQPQSIPLSGQSASSLETPWQAAQIRSPLPSSPVDYTFAHGSPDESSPDSLVGYTFSPAVPTKSSPEGPSDQSQPQDKVSQPRTPLRGQSSVHSDRAKLSQVANIVLATIEKGDAISTSPLRPIPSLLSSPFQETYKSDFSASPTSSPDKMADKLLNMNVADLLKQARATAAANTIARQAEARASSTPSRQSPAVAQTPPLEALARETPSITPPSPKDSPEIESGPKPLRVLPRGPAEYVVPLPLNSITRDVYRAEITNFRRHQKASLQDESADGTLVYDVESMVDRLNKLCDHQDLILMDPATQETVSWQVQAAWAEKISTKCIFLVELLGHLRSSFEHAVIIARPGRMQDIIDALLRQHGFAYRRPTSNATPRISNDRLRVTLLPSNFHDFDIEHEPASIIIAFDSTFNIERLPNELRVNPKDASSLAPVARLVAIRSAEHFELCLTKSAPSVDRRAALLGCILYARHDFGVVPQGYPGPPTAAASIAEFVGAHAPTWPLPPMPDVDDFELVDMDVGGQPSEVPPSGSTVETSSTWPSGQVSQPGFKRSLIPEEENAWSKRQRITPIVSDENLVGSASRLSEDASNAPGSISTATAAAVGDQPENTGVSGDDETGLVASLTKKLGDLEVQLRDRDALGSELRQRNQRLEGECRSLEKSVKDIQPKYQEALNDRGHFEHEMKAAISRESTLQQRLDSRLAELVKVKEEKATATAELSAACTALSTSAIPEVSEFHKMKDELQAAQKENERLQKRLANMQNESEYMRTNYQQASSAAGEAANELRELKSDFSATQRKADENTLRIHQLQASSEIKQHVARISELEAEKAELERELEKKAEELRTAQNGRRPTRGTSVSMSPRMGTMSPGSRPMARVLSSGVAGSRGSSPAPGEGPPYRGTFTGDALFTNAPGSSRWGNHLY